MIINVERSCFIEWCGHEWILTILYDKKDLLTVWWRTKCDVQVYMNFLVGILVVYFAEMFCKQYWVLIWRQYIGLRSEKEFLSTRTSVRSFLWHVTVIFKIAWPLSLQFFFCTSSLRWDAQLRARQGRYATDARTHRSRRNERWRRVRGIQKVHISLFVSRESFLFGMRSIGIWRIPAAGYIRTLDASFAHFPPPDPRLLSNIPSSHVILLLTQPPYVYRAPFLPSQLQMIPLYRTTRGGYLPLHRQGASTLASRPTYYRSRCWQSPREPSVTWILPGGRYMNPASNLVLHLIAAAQLYLITHPRAAAGTMREQ